MGKIFFFNFMSVWLERMGGWKMVGAWLFSPLTHHNFISPIWGENRGERNNCNQ